MKTNCPMKQLLQELLSDQIANRPLRNTESKCECCVISFIHEIPDYYQGATGINRGYQEGD